MTGALVMFAGMAAFALAIVILDWLGRRKSP
jgi:hypothetical protein